MAETRTSQKNNVIIYNLILKAKIMSKGKDIPTKTKKKEPTKNLKEKRAAKEAKRKEKNKE